jgi:hypothetical protein
MEKVKVNGCPVTFVAIEASTFIKESLGMRVAIYVNDEVFIYDMRKPSEKDIFFPKDIFECDVIKKIIAKFGIKYLNDVTVDELDFFDEIVSNVKLVLVEALKSLYTNGENNGRKDRLG